MRRAFALLLEAFLMEIDALYCDVIVERRKKVTARKIERVEETA